MKNMISRVNNGINTTNFPIFLVAVLKQPRFEGVKA